MSVSKPHLDMDRTPAGLTLDVGHTLLEVCGDALPGKTVTAGVDLEVGAPAGEDEEIAGLVWEGSCRTFIYALPPDVQDADLRIPRGALVQMHHVEGEAARLDLGEGGGRKKACLNVYKM